MTSYMENNEIKNFLNKVNRALQDPFDAEWDDAVKKCMEELKKDIESQKEK